MQFFQLILLFRSPISSARSDAQTNLSHSSCQPGCHHTMATQMNNTFFPHVISNVSQATDIAENFNEETISGYSTLKQKIQLDHQEKRNAFKKSHWSTSTEEYLKTITEEMSKNDAIIIRPLDHYNLSIPPYHPSKYSKDRELIKTDKNKEISTVSHVVPWKYTPNSSLDSEGFEIFDAFSGRKKSLTDHRNCSSKNILSFSKYIRPTTSQNPEKNDNEKNDAELNSFTRF